LAVNLRISINREDAKNAKKSAKQNSFQETKDLLLSITNMTDQHGFLDPFGKNFRSLQHQER